MAGRSGIQIRIVSNRLPGMPAAIRSAVAGEIEKAARRIEAGAKQDVAVDTGTLRRSITTQLSNGGLSAIVAAGTKYGHFVEFGTRRMPARPFLIPSFEREVPRLKAAVAQALRGLR